MFNSFVLISKPFHLIYIAETRPLHIKSHNISFWEAVIWYTETCRDNINKSLERAQTRCLYYLYSVIELNELVIGQFWFLVDGLLQKEITLRVDHCMSRISVMHIWGYLVVLIKCLYSTVNFKNKRLIDWTSLKPYLNHFYIQNVKKCQIQTSS